MHAASVSVAGRSASVLLSGTHELIAEIIVRLTSGESFNNAKFSEIADRCFGGTRAQGVYTPRDAYDALEVAACKLIESGAEEFAWMSAETALNTIIRPLMAQLPTQTDRTAEQTEWQQFSTPPALAYLGGRYFFWKNVTLRRSSTTH